MADNQFPVSKLDHHFARVFIYVTVPLLVIALASLAARMTIKIKGSLRIGWDDGLMIIGTLLSVIDWALLLAVISVYAPESQEFVSLIPFQNTIMLGVIAVPFWILAIGCIKISVAILLLRFQTNERWKKFLYCLIGFLVILSVGFFIFDLVQCVPLNATWDTSVKGKCVNTDTFAKASNTFAGFNIAIDIILSIFPLTFLTKINRPFLEIALVGILMAMGVVASAASVAKAVMVHLWATASDTFSIGFQISMYTCIEMFVGITAACLPCLKKYVQQALTAIGVDFTWKGTNYWFKSPSYRRRSKLSNQVGGFAPMNDQPGNEDGVHRDRYKGGENSSSNSIPMFGHNKTAPLSASTGTGSALQSGNSFHMFGHNKTAPLGASTLRSGDSSVWDGRGEP